MGRSFNKLSQQPYKLLNGNTTCTYLSSRSAVRQGHSIQLGGCGGGGAERRVDAGGLVRSTATAATTPIVLLDRSPSMAVVEPFHKHKIKRKREHVNLSSNSVALVYVVS